MRSHRVSVPTEELLQSRVKEMSAGGDALIMGNVSAERRSV